MCVPFLPGPGLLRAPASPCPGACPLFRAQPKCGSVPSIFLPLCRGNPARGDAIPGPTLKVLSTVVGGKSRDSGDGYQSPGQVYRSWEKRPKASESTDVEEGPLSLLGNVGT